ncbi:MAG: sulfatase-like hydrolase/transferase [Blastocatellia bacterium]|nr:sulfatase-like hydrolase/transferase [Blastocatellia bacterium]
MKTKDKRPNFLIFMVDEERYPPVYETHATKLFRKKNLKAQEWLRQYGMEFHRHYAAATACSPSRASLFTGQYPSLHGVTQTTGTAKAPSDPDVFWLDANTVPTMGDYFRAGGYRTFYKGKWHVSHADIVMAGSHDALESYSENGRPIKKIIDLYLNADRLDEYGFSGWIGPEPHGSKKANTGTNRDPGFAREAIELIEELDRERKKTRSQLPPWLIVNSFVNPHDVVLFGLAWQRFGYPYTKGWVPDIPPPETEKENLDTKPGCQQSYVDVYPNMLMPQPTSETYRQFYYYLQKESDKHIQKVYKALEKTSFFENTYIIFTSDHGEMLGAHGGMHQKWHNVYEETVHVPLIISHPRLFKDPRNADMLTSHVDLIPTLLGLAGIDASEAAKSLKQDHVEVRPLVGRDLSAVVRGKVDPDKSREPIYFMTDDEISSGLHQTNPVTGNPYTAVIQPNHVESVIAVLKTGENGEEQVWKYSRYFDNPQFWWKPFQEDVYFEDGKVQTRTKPVPSETEMYNVSADNLERVNLTHRSNSTRDLKKVQEELQTMLANQRARKRLYPEPFALYAKEIAAND